MQADSLEGLPLATPVVFCRDRPDCIEGILFLVFPQRFRASDRSPLPESNRQLLQNYHWRTTTAFTDLDIAFAELVD